MFLVYIPLSSPAHMVVLISSPRSSTLHCRFGHDVCIAGFAGRIGRFGVRGIDVACAAALESMQQEIVSIGFNEIDIVDS